MGNKLKLDSKTIVNNKFAINPKGYDALQVDTMLDKIVKDYETVENSELLTKEEYKALLDKIDSLNKQIIELSIELKKEKSRARVAQDGKGSSKDNYELLLRIGRLEKIIHEKLHLSLEEINSFDPDDC